MADRNPLVISFGSTGASAEKLVQGQFNVDIASSGTATVQLQRKFPTPAGNTQWYTVGTYTASTSLSLVEYEYNVSYRFNCSSYASGVSTCRLGMGDNGIGN